MTPSGWHDQAWRREAKHEAMQRELLAFLRSRSIAGLPETPLVRRTVEGEYLITIGRNIVGFADAVEILNIRLQTTVSLFEVKPRIDDLFAIVRQAKALLQLAKRAIPAEFHYCHLIVPHDDHKLAYLRREWPHTWAWGIQFPALEDDET